MGAAESTYRTGTNQEEEELKQMFSMVVATIAVAGVVAWVISRMLSDNTNTQENKSAMKMEMETEPSDMPEGSSQTSLKNYWSPPPLGRLKMNTDGGHRPNEHYEGSETDSAELRPSGYGGILRDHNGKWIRGFIRYIRVTDSLKSEFHGIHKGLLLLDKLELKGVILETDCQGAYQWVKRRDNNWGKKQSIKEYKEIIKECRELADKNMVEIELIDGDNANKCADGLAKIAIRKRVPYEDLMVPPNEIYHLIYEDAKLILR